MFQRFKEPLKNLAGGFIVMVCITILILAFTVGSPFTWFAWIPFVVIAYYLRGLRHLILMWLRRKKPGYLIGSVSGLLLFAVFTCTTIWSALQDGPIHRSWPAFALAAFASVVVGIWSERRWRFSNLPTAAEILAMDRRAPILYLRPFKNDGLRFGTFRTKTIGLELIVGLLSGVQRAGGEEALPRGEELIVDLFKPFGPVVAIGKPGEKVPPMGAARVYCTDDEWRGVVRKYMNESQFIVLFAGSTTHFGWEIGQVFQTEPFVPTVMLLPFFRGGAAAEVVAFQQNFTEATGLSLNADLENVRVVYFPDRNTAIPIARTDTPQEQELDGLNPFLGSMVQVLEPLNPGSTGIYQWRAKEGKLQFSSVLGLAGVVVLLKVIWMLIHL